MAGFGAVLEGVDGIGKPLTFDSFYEGQRLLMQKDAMLQRQKDDAAQREQDRIKANMGYLDKNINPEDHNSGTTLSRYVVGEYKKTTEALLPLVKKLAPDEFAMEAQKAAANVAGLYNAEKSFVDGWKTGEKEFEKLYLDFDNVRAKNLAMQEHFYKKDVNGKLIPKAPNEIQNDIDWKTKMVQDHPELVIGNGGAKTWKEYADNYQGLMPFNEEDQYDEKGNRLVAGGAGNYYPDMFKIKKDKKGNLVGLEMQKEDFVVDGKVIDQTIPDSKFKEVMNNPQLAPTIIADYKLKFPGKPLDGLQAEYEMKKIAGDRLEKTFNKGFKPNKDESEARKKTYFNEQEKLKADARLERKDNALINKLAGGDGKEEVVSRDLYGEVKKIAETANLEKNPIGKAFTLLPLDAQTNILAKLNASRAEGEKLTEKDVAIRYVNGNLEVTYVPGGKGRGIGAKDYTAATINPEDLNTGKVNPSVKERQSILQRGKNLYNKGVNAIKNVVTDPENIGI
jgi:hypothetical protein